MQEKSPGQCRGISVSPYLSKNNIPELQGKAGFINFIHFFAWFYAKEFNDAKKGLFRESFDVTQMRT